MSSSMIDFSSLCLVNFCRHNIIELSKLLEESENQKFNTQAKKLACNIKNFFQKFMNLQEENPYDSLKTFFMIRSAAQETFAGSAETSSLIGELEGIADKITVADGNAAKDNINRLMDFFDALALSIAEGV